MRWRVQRTFEGKWQTWNEAPDPVRARAGLKHTRERFPHLTFRLVRVLSHDEAKRRATARELRAQAARLRKFGTVKWAVADELEARAAELWSET